MLDMALLRVYPKIGVGVTGHSRTLAKMSKDNLIGLIDQGKTWVPKYNTNVLFF